MTMVVMAVALSVLAAVGALITFLGFANVLPVVPCRRRPTPQASALDAHRLEQQIRAFAEAAASGNERAAERAAREVFGIPRHGFALRRWGDVVAA